MSLDEELRRIHTMSIDERKEFRNEIVQRLFGGDLSPFHVDDLVRALRHADQKGTPFERLSLAEPEDDDVDIDEIIDELLDSFYASPEAAAAADAEELRFWAGELVRQGVLYGHDSPVTWGPETIVEILSDLLPAKITIDSAGEARQAVPAFRTFFRWASRVAPATDAEAIDAALAGLEPEFPDMMMDPARFGPAKAFVVQGAAAGFDMTSEEGMLEFQEQWNREHAAPAAAAAASSRKKLDAVKKRKAKMAKLSRRKNRKKK